MNGLYRIPLAPGEDPAGNFKVKALLTSLAIGAEYSIEVVERLLTIDGRAAQLRPTFKYYAVDATRYVEIRASGGKEKRRAAPKSKRTAPPPPDLAACQRKYKDACETLASARSRVAGNIRRQWQPEAYGFDAPRYNADLETKNDALGAAVGRVIAIHRSRNPHHITATDYAILDAAMGCKVPRLSTVTARNLGNGYLAYLVWNYGKTTTGYCSPNWTHHKYVNTSDLEPGEVRETAIMSCLNVKAEVEYWAEMVRLHESCAARSANFVTEVAA